MEQPPKISTIESHDEARKAVVEALKKNPDDLSPLHEYLETREHWVEEKGPEERIELILHTAEIYLDAGRVESARQAFEDAISHAEEVGKHELAQRIRSKLHEVRAS